MGMEIMTAFFLFKRLRDASIIMAITSFSLKIISRDLISVRAKKSFIVTMSVTVDFNVDAIAGKDIR